VGEVMPDQDGSTDFRRDYPWLDTEGDCSVCDGTGEVICHAAGCEGSGCSHCIDGLVECENCSGSGYCPDPELFYREEE
jgi:hypothetical protein